MTFIKGARFRAKGSAPDPEFPSYKFFEPADTGDWEICDCYIVDAAGNRSPNHLNSPIPTHWSRLGKMLVTDQTRVVYGGQ